MANSMKSERRLSALISKASKKVSKKASKASTKKVPTKKASTKKAAPKGALKGEGYKGHREGSIKAQAHEIFDKYLKDPEKAKELASKLKIKPNTVNSWFSEFRHS